MSLPLTFQQKQDIIWDYTVNLVPMIALAERYKITRQGIWKILKRESIDTNKRRLTVLCSQCGIVLKRAKCQIRSNKLHYCNLECYYQYVNAIHPGVYKNNRQGQNIARNIVAQYVELLPGYIVHHQDKDTTNNNPNNLMVFKNQSDHLRYHRGVDVKPFWNGATYKYRYQNVKTGMSLDGQGLRSYDTGLIHTQHGVDSPPPPHCIR